MLNIAIAAEIVATPSLKASDGVSRLGFGAVSIIGYGVAFHFTALVLKSIPIGVALIVAVVVLNTLSKAVSH